LKIICVKEAKESEKVIDCRTSTLFSLSKNSSNDEFSEYKIFIYSKISITRRVWLKHSIEI